MYWAEFLTVALIHLLAVASPGPDFAVVVRESVTHGRRAGTWTAFGVGTAIFLHVGYSLLGIGLIVSQSIMLFNALKWAAAAYLIKEGKLHWICTIPAIFMTAVVITYLANAPIGFGLTMNVSTIIGLVSTALITLAFLVKFRPSQLREAKES